MAANWFSAPAPMARRVRAYFAPVGRAAQTPVLFDPAQQGGFNLDSPPAPWISLGWIQEFSRKASSRTAPIQTGIPAGTLEQVRETLEAQVSFQFLSWTKLTMALATGSQHMNLLAPASGATAAANGAQASAAVALQSGSSATAIVLATTDAAKFTAGSLIALDTDYTGQTGFVGAPIAGAYVRQALTDVDYIRRVTFNVALVSQANSTGLVLAEPLPGGIPAGGGRMRFGSGAVVVATVVATAGVFGGGAASAAGPDLSGQTYEKAAAVIKSWNETAIIAFLPTRPVAFSMKWTISTANTTCRLLNITDDCSAGGTTMNSLASARVQISRMM